jgi:phosphoglycolate phosphatase-like HAD superfamily hydrolase
MDKIAFDFDNTLVSCISSDYEVYRLTCIELALSCIEMSRYSLLRNAGKYADILSETHVTDRDGFKKTREKYGENELLNMNDAPILNYNLLTKIASKYDLYIISSRNSMRLLEAQVDKLGWSSFFNLRCVPRISEIQVIYDKKRILNEILPKYFVGDKSSDLAAASGASVTPILVETGFWRVDYPGIQSFKDVNYFLKKLIR